MQLPDCPFSTIKWSEILPEEHTGVTGKAYWRTKYMGDIRIRLVEYSKDYFADHWCSKGHIIYILRGELNTELKDGRNFILKEGMSYIAGDNDIPHRSGTSEGALLLIID